MQQQSEKQKAAIAELHRAAQALSYFESDDYAITNHGAGEATKLRGDYNEAIKIATEVGVDVAAELKGKGYRL